MKGSVYILILVWGVFVFCSGDSSDSNELVFENGKWLYQLQGVDPSDEDIGLFDYVVMDYSRDGSESNKYTSQDIATIKDKGVSVLCYISIGEAEDYRFYWDSNWTTSPPTWLGRENPDWDGNYKVRYWDTNWQSIVYTYLDKIIEAGFDGVYLDIIDAYEYWADNENEERFYTNIEWTASNMISFVCTIAEYCQSKKSNFMIVPQNGEGIIKYDNGRYINAISGIGVEDVFYDGTEERDFAEYSNRVYYLQTIVSSNKFVLSVEYFDDGSSSVGERIEDYSELVNEYGFAAYVAKSDRSLDEINIFW